MVEIARQLGLDRCPPFYKDISFLMALLAGGFFWFGIWMFSTIHFLAIKHVWSWGFISLVLWKPLLEELLFRGFLQGMLSRQFWAQQAIVGITVANSITSLLFMVGHLGRHTPKWAIAVIVPSLIYGYFRDRYRSVYPSVALHSFYNTGYFLLTGVPR